MTIDQHYEELRARIAASRDALDRAQTILLDVSDPRPRYADMLHVYEVLIQASKSADDARCKAGAMRDVLYPVGGKDGAAERPAAGAPVVPQQKAGDHRVFTGAASAKQRKA